MFIINMSAYLFKTFIEQYTFLQVAFPSTGMYNFACNTYLWSV